MSPLDLLSVAALFVGTVLVLDAVPWFRERPLAERLRPYSPAPDHPGTSERRSRSGMRHVLGPVAIDLGRRVSSLLGVPTELSTRLERAGREPDTESFRLRQLSHALLSMLAGTAAVLALRPPPLLGAAVAVGAPLLAVLLHEHALSAAVSARQERLRAELPVLVEQLGLLISAGYSVTGALNRIAARSTGVACEDLQRVLLRIRHGLGEHDALGEWATRSDLDVVARLTSVLAMHGETTDLGLLIADEARSLRAEAHRALVETIERRAQLVWIPVTVATLVPGLVFLAVPFMSAMSAVTGG